MLTRCWKQMLDDDDASAAPSAVSIAPADGGDDGGGGGGYDGCGGDDDGGGGSAGSDIDSTDRPTDRSDRPTDRSDRVTDRPTVRPTDRPTDRPGPPPHASRGENGQQVAGGGIECRSNAHLVRDTQRTFVGVDRAVRQGGALQKSGEAWEDGVDSAPRGRPRAARREGPRVHVISAPCV